MYVWAIEQDEKSKRSIPSTDHDPEKKEQDVLVPWVLTGQNAPEAQPTEAPSQLPEQTYQRYYHMFAAGELRALTEQAAHSLGLVVGPCPPSPDTSKLGRGLEIVAEGWERSNYYVEVRLWDTHPDPAP